MQKQKDSTFKNLQDQINLNQPCKMRFVDVGQSRKPDRFAARCQNRGQGQLGAVAAVSLIFCLDHDHAATDVKDQARALVYLLTTEITHKDV